MAGSAVPVQSPPSEAGAQAVPQELQGLCAAHFIFAQLLHL